VSVRSENLCVALTVLDEAGPVLCGQLLSGAGDDLGEVLCTLLQPTLEREREM
jgi:hypothetical protein